MVFLKRFPASLSLMVALLAGCAQPPAPAPAHPAPTAQVQVAPAPPAFLVVVSERPPVPVVRFAGEISAASAVQLAAVLAQLAPAHPRAVVLEINSVGGSVPWGYEAARAIERAPYPVACVVDGEAASMAFFVLQSCDARYMTLRSQLMVHQPWEQLQGAYRAHELANEAEGLAATAEAMLAHEARRLKVSVEYVRAKVEGGREWNLGPAEALRVGAVDRLVPDAQIVTELLRTAP